MPGTNIGQSTALVEQSRIHTNIGDVAAEGTEIRVSLEGSDTIEIADGGVVVPLRRSKIVMRISKLRDPNWPAGSKCCLELPEEVRYGLERTIVMHGQEVDIALAIASSEEISEPSDAALRACHCG